MTHCEAVQSGSNDNVCFVVCRWPHTGLHDMFLQTDPKCLSFSLLRGLCAFPFNEFHFVTIDWACKIWLSTLFVF